MTQAFEGATTGARLERKGLLSGNADSLAVRELNDLRKRSRHLCRNNALAISAKNKTATHQLGQGIKVQFSKKSVQKEWNVFIENPSVDSYGDLYNLQHLILHTEFEAGEVFALMHIKEHEKSKVPLKVQTLEPEHLDLRFNQALNIRNGIEFDDFGKPEKYHFWKYDPTDFQNRKINSRVVVEARDVLHVFNRTRPSQWRGIPRLAGCLLSIYELDELLDAALVRQKLAQAMGWVVEYEGNEMPLVGATHNGTDPETGEKQLLQKITPGGVHYFKPGQRVKFATSEDIGNNFSQFIRTQIQLIASCLDLTYEQLTGDLSGVNYSSIRAALIEISKRVETVRKLVFINLFLKPLVERFLELGKIYIGQSFSNVTYKFVFPKEEWVDPLKDAQADLLEVQAGFSTLEAKLAERGVEDFDAHIMQLAKEQGLKIVLTSNPSQAQKQTAEGAKNKTAKTKTGQNPTKNTEPPTTGNEDE